eukprot:6804504-Pyramimonas_sp.AAC.1
MATQSSLVLRSRVPSALDSVLMPRVPLGCNTLCRDPSVMHVVFSCAPRRDLPECVLMLQLACGCGGSGKSPRCLRAGDRVVGVLLRASAHGAGDRCADDWWKVCDFSFSSFVRVARDYLAHCKLADAFECSVRPRGGDDGGGGGSRGGGGGQAGREASRARSARRLGTCAMAALAVRLSVTAHLFVAEPREYGVLAAEFG